MGLKGGEAVRVGRMIEAAVGSAQVIGNVIDNYERNGVTVDNAGSSAGITHNRIFGVNGSLESQNGIQVSRGATATIRHNFVSLNVFGPGGVASTGILLFFPAMTPSAPLTDHNTVASNDQGLYMWGSGSGTTTSHNRVRASGFEGVVLDGAMWSEIGYNKSDYNGTSGIKAFNNSNLNSLHNNKATHNGANGILLGDYVFTDGVACTDFQPGANNNTVSQNKVSDNGTSFGTTDECRTHGIHINMGSTGNFIDRNHLRHNVFFDCYDGNFPAANTWTDNHGQTEAPPPSTAVCTKDDNDADYADDDYGWDPNDPWYNNFDGASSYDWVGLYATIDTDSILGLLPQLPPVLGIPVPVQ